MSAACALPMMAKPTPNVSSSWLRCTGINLPKHSTFRVKAFFLNPNEQPVLRQALKEPVAFLGGIFAGVLRLDLNEDPLKEWVTRTVEASGITEEEIDGEASSNLEEVPQQIEIE